MDCECFQIDGKRIFREVSIFDLRTLSYEVLHCFAEDFCYEMDERKKYAVRCQRRIHGLYFYNKCVKIFF